MSHIMSNIPSQRWITTPICAKDFQQILCYGIPLIHQHPWGVLWAWLASMLEVYLWPVTGLKSEEINLTFLASNVCQLMFNQLPKTFWTRWLYTKLDTGKSISLWWHINRLFKHNSFKNVVWTQNLSIYG